MRGAVRDEPCTQAPQGLRESEIEVAGARFVVLSYPSNEERLLRRLTEAEAIVVRLALRGLSNEQIAYVRDKSARTIANQLASVFRKLEVRSRVELAARLRTPEDATP